MSQGRLRFFDKNMNYMFEIKGLFSSGDRKQVFYYEKKANVNVSLFFNIRIFERWAGATKRLAISIYIVLL